MAKKRGEDDSVSIRRMVQKSMLACDSRVDAIFGAIE
jgi:hypothetical protein